MPHLKPNPAQNNSLSEVVRTVIFYVIVMVVAIVTALYVYDKGVGGVVSVMIGVTVSVLGIVGVWFANWIIWLIIMSVTRGAPFKLGDRVEITNGEYKGTIGKVSEVFEGRYVVRVMLEVDEEFSQTFNWNEVRRVPTK